MAAFDGTTYAVGTHVIADGDEGVIEVVGRNGWYIVNGQTVHHARIIVIPERCSCAVSQVYGGDCAHTIEGEYEAR